jgi:hypothetical protein
MDERADVILDEFRLGGTDPTGGAAQGLGQQHHAGHEGDQEQEWGERISGATGACCGNEVIDEKPRRVDAGNRERSLDEEGRGPDDGSAAGRRPAQGQRPWQKDQLSEVETQFVGQDSQAFGNRSSPLTLACCTLRREGDNPCSLQRDDDAGVGIRRDPESLLATSRPWRHPFEQDLGFPRRMDLECWNVYFRARVCLRLRAMDS